MMNVAPLIETDRLRLRPHCANDLDDSICLWTDEMVCRFTIGSPATRSECWQRILRYIGHWHALGFGYWVVEDKASGAFMGELGFGEFMRGIEPSIEGSLEAGWVLLPEFHRLGYAQEALTEVLSWRDKNFPSRTVTCLIDPDNAASLRLAERLGFIEQARIDSEVSSSILFELIG